jgi:hypothetical protein
MITNRVCFKNKITGIKLRIFYRETQLLPVERKVADLPGVLHDTLQFHLHIHLLARTINERKGFIYSFCLRHFQVL